MNERIFNIVFIWVPSHVGIGGYEGADGEAHRAANSETKDVNFVKVSDFYKYISYKSIDISQIKKIHPNMRSTYPVVKLPRNNMTIVFVQVILRSHMDILKLESRPMCEHRNESITVNS